MNRFTILLSLAFILDNANAQSLDDHVSQSSFVRAYDISGKPFTDKRLENVEGSPMFSPDWNLGNVTFKNGTTVKDIPLQFNLYDNQVYFRKDTVLLAFVQPVTSFEFAFTDNGVKRLGHFSNGYPFVQNNNEWTYYQILAAGPLQLLKYSYATLVEKPAYAQSSHFEFQMWHELYAYDSNNKTIVKIKDRSSLANAFPEFADRINEYAAQHHSKLKSEEDLTALFNTLNQ